MRNDKGFTLVEILIYIAVLAVIILTVSSFFLWATRSNSKTKATGEVLTSSRRALAIMAQEIREAKSVYTPTSVFAATSGQLSLETTKYLPAGESTSYIDFYLCGTQLCQKKESQNPVALTSERVEINNLFFNQILTTSTLPSIQISLKVDYKNPGNLPEYQASIEATTTASLRAY
jgi:prepilin-type N-terminal cleavage/methylation domain-containing protein